jgi:hypothetical protein
MKIRDILLLKARGEIMSISLELSKYANETNMPIMIKEDNHEFKLKAVSKDSI